MLLNKQLEDEMKKEEIFKIWLQEQNFDSKTINSRVSSYKRLCAAEGDLDDLYNKNLYEDLLNRLSYSIKDEKSNAKPRHKVKINGNIRTGSASLKQAATLYKQFLLNSGNVKRTKIQSKAQKAKGYSTKTGKIISKKQNNQQEENQVIRDSYSRFIARFNIDIDDFFNYGIEETIFAPLDYAKKQWTQQISKLENNQEIYIRRYGEKGNTFLYKFLYWEIFGNSNILIDPTKNAIPLGNIQHATNSVRNNNLFNYECSHIFGCTKNPLLFGAVWNICFKPKIYDPLSGHVTMGIWPEEYQKRLRSDIFNRFKYCIDSYNTFTKTKEIHDKITNFEDEIKEESKYKLKIEQYIDNLKSSQNTTKKVEQYISQIKLKVDSKVLDRFFKDAKEQWEFIV